MDHHGPSCSGVEMSSMPSHFGTENSFGEKNALLDTSSGGRVDYGMTRVTRAARRTQEGAGMVVFHLWDDRHTMRPEYTFIIYTYYIHILYTHIIYIYYNIVIHDYTYFQGTHMVWLRNGALSSPWIPQTLRPPDNCWIVSSCPWCFEIFSPSYPILAILFGFKPPVRRAFLVPMDYPDRLDRSVPRIYHCPLYWWRNPHDSWKVRCHQCMAYLTICVPKLVKIYIYIYTYMCESVTWDSSIHTWHRRYLDPC